MKTSALQEFMKGDLSTLIQFVAVILIIKYWGKSNWLKIGSTLIGWGIVDSTIGGKHLLRVVGWAFRTFLGIEIGL